MRNFKDAVKNARYNPELLMSAVYDFIEDGSGFELVEASNPAALLAEATATIGTNLLREHEVLSRVMNKAQATSYEDLYAHMSDADYLDRFSLPAQGEFILFMSLEEVKQFAPLSDGNVRTLTISKDYEFTVDGVNFGIYYPIDIRVMPHGTVKVVWDTSVPNPLHTLTTNVVESTVMPSNDGLGDILAIRIPANQFSITRTVGNSTGDRPYTETISYTDQYYHARVYSLNTNGRWDELHTTHSDQVYDPRRPTAKLKVLENTVQVSIPQVYYENGLIGKQIRTELYTTRGIMSMDLSLFRNGEVTLVDRFPEDTKPLSVSAFSDIQTATIIGSSQDTIGGANARSVTELLDSLTSTSDKGIASLDDVHDHFRRRGYALELRSDNLTDRRFLASRQLALSTETETVSTPGIANQKLNFKLKELEELPGIGRWEDSYTIPPTTLYELVGDSLVISKNETLLNPETSSKIDIASSLNTGTFLYTPFHYVVDNGEDRFDIRAYYMDSPEIVNREFVDINPTYPIELGINAIVVERTSNGYRIVLRTRSSDNVRELPDDTIYVQLSCLPRNSGRRVYMNGVMRDTLDLGERVYTFDLPTEFAIDAADGIRTSGFRFNPNDLINYVLDLVHEMDITFAIDLFPGTGTTGSSLDSLRGLSFMPETARVVSHERIRVKLGSRLKELEKQPYSYLASDEFLTYDEDVPLLHEEPSYKVNITDDNDVSYELVADVGDAVVVDGQPVLKHRKGDLKLVDGKKVLVEAASSRYEFELVLVDAAYRFSNEVAISNFRDSIPERITSYIEDDLANLKKKMAPRTTLLFSPQNTLGTVDITVANGTVTSVDAGLVFNVDIYTDAGTVENPVSRREIERTAKEVLVESLSERTLDRVAIATAIKERIGESAIAVNVGRLTEQRLDVFTVLGNSSGLSVRSVMEVLPNGTLQVQDDITINILRHTV